jgi:hypothetical protein
MAVALSISVEGIAEVDALLGRINPKKNPAVVRRALLKAGALTQSIAAKEKIKRGGKGPPEKDRLTSRTGTLRRSIGINRGPLPWAVEVGTPLIYGVVHEVTGAGKAKRVRPFLKPALDKAAKSFDDIFAREIAKEIAK